MIRFATLWCLGRSLRPPTPKPGVVGSNPALRANDVKGLGRENAADLFSAWPLVAIDPSTPPPQAEHSARRCCTARREARSPTKSRRHQATIFTDSGLPSLVIVLSTLTPILASLTCASSLFERRLSPMIRLYRSMEFSARAC